MSYCKFSHISMVMCAACVYTCISICFSKSRYPDTDGILIPGPGVLVNVNGDLIGLITLHKSHSLRLQKHKLGLIVEYNSIMLKEDKIMVVNSIFCNRDAIICVALLQFRELFVPSPPPPLSPAACLPPLSV